MLESVAELCGCGILIFLIDYCRFKSSFTHTHTRTHEQPKEKTTKTKLNTASQSYDRISTHDKYYIQYYYLLLLFISTTHSWICLQMNLCG